MIASICLCALCFFGTPDTIENQVTDTEVARKETIVLLHGMGRTRVSMKLLEHRLRKAGFKTLNFPYSVRKTDLDDIVSDFHQFLDKKVNTEQYHLIGHSLGNIIIREAFKQEFRSGLGRIVMIAPPNQPAALAEKLGDNPVFKFITKDAGQKLGSQEFYDKLPVPTVEFGILAGDIGQSLTFNEPNDGIVAVENTKLEGAKSWKLLHHTHTLIMNAKDTAKHCVNFVNYGIF